MTAEAAKAEETAVEATGEELRVAEVRAAVVREAEDTGSHKVHPLCENQPRTGW